MEEYLKYIIVSFILLLLDVLWISTNLKMYSSSVKSIQKIDLSVNYTYAIVAYAFVLFASLYIAIPFTKHYINKNDSIGMKFYKSLIYGGSIGLAVNGIYNFTSMSIYKNYELKVAIIDTIWGIILNTLTVFIYLSL